MPTVEAYDFWCWSLRHPWWVYETDQELVLFCLGGSLYQMLRCKDSPVVPKIVSAFELTLEVLLVSWHWYWMGSVVAGELALVLDVIWGRFLVVGGWPTISVTKIHIDTLHLYMVVYTVITFHFLKIYISLWSHPRFTQFYQGGWNHFDSSRAMGDTIAQHPNKKDIAETQLEYIGIL